MKRNNIILAGFIFILFAGVLFITDIFNPIIRPITRVFLMGSSKGKDMSNIKELLLLQEKGIRVR